MARIVHLSDLHFGRDRADLVAPLIEAVNALAPDLIAISGDLTQRARSGQFRAARRLLGQFNAPVLAVPGNHDVPLWNLPARILSPFSRWRHYVGPDLAPRFTMPGLLALGLTSVDPFAWQRGRIQRPDLDEICEDLRAAPEGTLKVVVLHHPLVHPDGSDKAPMAGASDAAAALAAAGADVFLSGHLHSWGAAPILSDKGGRAALCIQAGTGLSTRVRGEENDFNLIEHDGSTVMVTRYCVPDGAPVFDACAAVRFGEGPEGWRPRA